MNTRTPGGARCCSLLRLLCLGALCGCAWNGPPLPDDPDVLLVSRQSKAAPVGQPSVIRLAALHGHPLAPSWGKTLNQSWEEGRPVSASRLQQALEAAGFTVFTFSGNLGRSATGLRHQLDLGRPVLVLSGKADEPLLWELVVGYDDDAQVCLLQRNQGDLVARSYEDFSRRWSRSDRMMLLAMPSSTLQNEL